VGTPRHNNDMSSVKKKNDDYTTPHHNNDMSSVKKKNNDDTTKTWSNKKTPRRMMTIGLRVGPT
jgi:hypothetical protein